MIVLGISALYHDSAAALIKDGHIIAAVQEERFTRIKGDSRLPVNSIRYCLNYLENECIDYVAFYDNPLQTLDRWLCNTLNKRTILSDEVDAIKFCSDRLWIHERVKDVLKKLGIHSDIRFVVCNHHISHAASAFYPSPFNSAAILCIDGVGEWTTTSLGVGRGNDITLLKEIKYPHSLGLLYSSFTAFCGFKVNFGEYKLMGLAPYGDPKWVSSILENIVETRADGSFRLNLEYFSFIEGECMYSDKFQELFNVPPRKAESAITKEYADIAASIQKVIEIIILRLATYLKTLTKQRYLVMAGGCALNCVVNGVLANHKIYDDIWVQPASNDSGGAIGAALYVYYRKSKNKRALSLEDSQGGSFLGPEYSNEQICKVLKDEGILYKFYEEEDLCRYVAKKLAENKVIGLFNGKMEFGPRALGHRSIIASAIHKRNQKKVNLKIKFRESFRPFAPSVLLEDANNYFLLDKESPYMLFVSYVKPEIRTPFKEQGKFSINNIINAKRSQLPAITHVDYSARIQTVDNVRNPRFYHIIKEYKTITGYGVVLNTSFNVRGEPIVCTPQDAINCFRSTNIDILVLNNYIIDKNSCYNKND